jgi:hypothetical protein
MSTCGQTLARNPHHPRVPHPHEHTDSQHHRILVPAATRKTAVYALPGARPCCWRGNPCWRSVLRRHWSKACGCECHSGRGAPTAPLRQDPSAAELRDTGIDLESDLGLPQRQPVRTTLIGLRWREHWHAESEHFSLKRQRRDSRIAPAFTLGDTVCNGSARIDTDFDARVTRASLGNAFWRGPGHVTGVVLGLQATAEGLHPALAVAAPALGCRRLCVKAAPGTDRWRCASSWHGRGPGRADPAGCPPPGKRHCCAACRAARSLAARR